MFEVVSLHGHAAGQALFGAIDSKVFKFYLTERNKKIKFAQLEQK